MKKELEEECFNQCIGVLKQIINTWRIIIESSYLTYLGANNLYGWVISQKLPVNGFMWYDYVSEFNEDFIKNYDENSDVGYFLEVDVEYPKNYGVLIMAYHFY